MSQILTGTIHGNTIILDTPPSPTVADGEHVEVVLRAVKSKGPWGEGIKNSTGGWKDYPELDAVMDTIHAERAVERRSAEAP
jgi:hypothetical protein